MTSRKPLVFEKLSTFERLGADASPSPLNEGIFRAQVPGGWLILLKADQPTLFFYPDPSRRWDGGSMDRGGVYENTHYRKQTRKQGY